MKKSSVAMARFAGLSLVALSALSYQNCAPVHVEDLVSNEYDKPSLSQPNLPEPDDQPSVQIEEEIPVVEAMPEPAPVPVPPPPLVVIQPPVMTVPETEMDPREIRCRGISPSTIPSIVYDSRPVTGSSPKTIKGFVGNKTIDTETVSKVARFVGKIKVWARTIGTVEGFATTSADFNAQSIDEIQGFVARDIEVVTHSLREAKNFGADFCLSAQSVESITNLASRLSLYGRGENGQRSKLGRLGNVAGFISIYNFDIGDTEGLRNAAIKAKLVNSRLTKLENAAVELVLVDSIIEEVSDVAGHIHLKGNSQILKMDNSSVKIIED